METTSSDSLSSKKTETSVNSVNQLRLTQTVQKGGCAAKVAASELREILRQVRFPPKHSELLVDGDTFDDAAIYKVTGDVALVQTLDFFTPIVDSPKIFGAIAATNALSDVYAMGGLPKTAMAILGFPLASLPPSVIVEVLQGAADKVAESRANFVGGHSIDDDTLKFGLSVTGFVDPAYVWSNAKAKPGDILILTKALGTGTATAALKRSAVTEEQINEEIQSMTTLNNVCDFLDTSLQRAVHAATDITGFGLLGHAMQMAQASGVQVKLNMSRIPRFSKTTKFLQEKFLTKAHRTNAEYVKEKTQYDGEFCEPDRLLLVDPQTSGGLLLAVDPDFASLIFETLKKQFPQSSIVGCINQLSTESQNTQCVKVQE